MKNTQDVTRLLIISEANVNKKKKKTAAVLVVSSPRVPLPHVRIIIPVILWAATDLSRTLCFV